MQITTLKDIISSLKAGTIPKLPIVEFDCFSEGSTQGDPHVTPNTLQDIATSLSIDDVPTFERAIVALKEGEKAWLAF